MKIQFGALLLATLVLAGCENPNKAAAVDANGQPVATNVVPKRKCDASTGSRMGNCSDQASPDVAGTSGDGYKMSTFGKATQASSPF